MTYEDIIKHDADFQFMMLSRLLQDVEYYFGHGGRNVKHLWVGTIKEHLKYVEKLFNHLEPEWLTTVQIEWYKSQSEIPSKERIFFHKDFKLSKHE